MMTEIYTKESGQKRSLLTRGDQKKKITICFDICGLTMNGVIPIDYNCVYVNACPVYVINDVWINDKFIS